VTRAIALALGVLLAAAATAQDAPTVVVQFLVHDRQEAPVVDLKPAELELRQDDVAQAVDSLRPAGAPGAYELRYQPKSGQPGPVMLRVLRPGAVASGPDGGPLRIRVEAVLDPLERRLVPLLEAAEAPRGLDHHVSVLRFERDGEKVHHTFAVEVPLATLDLRAAGSALRGSVGLLAQVKNAAGELVQRFSLEYPIEVEPSARERVLAERLVWTSHLHLPAGRYELETAVADLGTSAAGVGRTTFEAPATTEALRVSSVSVLAAGGALSVEAPSADNPLQYQDRQLVPAYRRQLVIGGEEKLLFYVVVYPEASRTEAPHASLELYRSGALVARGAIVLPPGTGAIPYTGSFPVAKLTPGEYEMKVVVRQGPAIAAESATFEMVPPPKLGSPDEKK
jgi:hypothetical protein